MCKLSRAVAQRPPSAAGEQQPGGRGSALRKRSKVAPANQKAMVPYSDKERTNWQFVPLPSRKGLPMMEMSADQQTAARNLLKAAVSQAGFEKATKIKELENVLRKLEGPRQSRCASIQ